MNPNRHIIILIIFLFGCESDYSPKPKAFMKIDLPEKKYLNYKSSCGYSFEYPYYAKINKLNKCMLDVEFSDLSAKLHISYFQLNSPNDLGIHIEESLPSLQHFIFSIISLIVFMVLWSSYTVSQYKKVKNEREILDFLHCLLKYYS